MKKSILSIEDIVDKANDRLRKTAYFNNNKIRPLRDVALGLEFISEDSNFDSGIYLYEQGLTDYAIDKRAQLCGICDDETRQTIRKKYVAAQETFVQLIGHIGKMGQIAPNLQKLLTSDLLLTAIGDYGLCYDFSKIEELLPNDLDLAEEMAARDLFFLKTYSYCFKAQNIANKLGKVSLTPQNKLEMDKTMQMIFRSHKMVSKIFPNNLKVTFKNYKEKKLPTKNVNSEMNKHIYNDLSLIKQVLGDTRKRESPAF